MVRGDINNPILLFLHGGPGIPYSPIAHEFQKNIEKSFLVVNWDQRGAGKSYNSSIAVNTMNLDQFILDTKEVVDYLIKEYNKNKIFMAAQSMGTVYGLMTVYKYPDKFYGYIGSGQMIDTYKSEKLSYDFILNKAKVLNNIEAVEELLEIGNPPYDNLIEDIGKERKWLNILGYIERNSNYFKMLTDNCSEEEIDIIMKGQEVSIKHLFTDIYKKNIDFNKTIKKIKVPTYFCMGRYDYVTPQIIVQQYCDKLIAPRKRCIWFEESAHFPEIEEPNKYYNTLINILGDTFN